MTGENPYNCAKPGNLFVGYDRLRQQLLAGLRNGQSFAIMGGRRCGKTSLLLQIEKDLQAHGLAPFTPLPRFLDIQGLGRVTPTTLFRMIYQLIIREVGAPPWRAEELEGAYQDFLVHLETVKPTLDQRYGSHWRVILLVDELDAALSRLPDDQFFQNLRNLLMVSSFSSYFCLVASGVEQLENLISSGSSPLNNLRKRSLGTLTSKQARQLVAFGFPQGLDPETELFLFQLTGRHPYLLQGLLEKLWEEHSEVDRKAVRGAAREFLSEHHDFSRWLDAFGPAEHSVYQLLSEAPEGRLPVHEIRHRLDASLKPKIDDALTVLRYHGVVDESDPDEPQLAGTLFRDWYRDHGPGQKDQLQQKPQTHRARALRLFYSYSDKDEKFRDTLETHLSLLKREGVIENWHDRKIGAGQEWEKIIDENLEAAHIILLLVSADFLASNYCMEKEMQRALERHEAGEARVIPVILRHVDWNSAPFAKLEALPRDAKPVNSWCDPDEAWANVARGIRRVAEEMRNAPRTT